MAERRTTPQASRSSAQRQLDTRAIEIAVATDARQEAHEKVCAERYRNIEANSARTEAAIRELGGDARQAIENVAKQNTEHHNFNAGTLKTLTDDLGELKQEMAAVRSKAEGERSAVNFLLRNLPTVFTATMLILTVLWHK